MEVTEANRGHRGQYTPQKPIEATEANRGHKGQKRPMEAKRPKRPREAKEANGGQRGQWRPKRPMEVTEVNGGQRGHWRPQRPLSCTILAILLKMRLFLGIFKYCENKVNCISLMIQKHCLTFPFHDNFIPKGLFFMV